jgi:hypothetical protein
MPREDGRRTKALLLAILGAAPAIAFGTSAVAARASGGAHHAVPAQSALTNAVFATATTLTHVTPKGKQQLSAPDDITYLAGHIFVGFQNGVGPQGQASPAGDKDSTVVEFDQSGHAVAQWDIVGKCDGLTADPSSDRVIATVNEDANSSIYLIDPARTAAVHYGYNEPLPSDGGTDAIEAYDGMVLVSASAPGTTGAAAPKPTYPAVYRVSFDAASHVAVLDPLFYDEASAAVANTNSPDGGKSQRLALTDPDSNEDVPAYATRFAGDFMLTSQGDKQQIFVAHAGSAQQTLSVLSLSDSVDDTVWPSERSGTLYATDNGNDTIDKITGPFARGSVLVAVTPCDANGVPSTCPAPGYPANYLGELDPQSGAISRVELSGPSVAVQGMLFVP